MDTVKVLTTIPSTDGNFLSALETASLAQLKYAVQIMKLNKGGQNASRIKAIEKKIADFGKKPTEKKSKVSSKETATIKETAPKKEEKPKELEVTAIDNAKRPKILPFKTKAESGHTYEECEKKLKAELKKFTDNDSAYVVDGILERCKVDKEFCNNVMRKDKTYEGFYRFMFETAKNGYCTKVGNIGGVLDANQGLELAFDYFSGDIEKPEKKANTGVTKAPEKKAEKPKKETVEDKITQGTFDVLNDGQLTFNF